MISVKNIHRFFGDKHVLKDVSFDIKPGLLTGFVGGNGAGKTTTMRIILGVLAAHEGEVLVDGASITRVYRSNIGYMPEERGLYPKMKVIDQLVYLGELHGMEADDARQRGNELLERLGLVGKPTDTLESLSLGNQQRVQVAAALIHRPAALILDEPFSGLDPAAVDSMIGALMDVAATGAPVLFSSHQLDLVERICDELVIIANGEIRANGTKDQILAKGVTGEYELHSDADTGWVREAGVQVLDFDGGYVKFAAADEAAANSVLREAVTRGTVHSFAPASKTLHEIYQEITR